MEYRIANCAWRTEATLQAPHTRRASARAVTLVFVSLSAALIGGYLWLRPHPSFPPLPTENVQQAQEWLHARRESWEAAGFIPIADGQAIREVVSEAIRNQKRPRLEIDAQLLGDAITQFLQGFACRSAREYMDRVAGRRRFRTDLFDDKYIHLQYQLITGRTMPFDVSPQQLLELFWQGHPQARERPAAVGRIVYVEVAPSRSFATSRKRRPDDPFYLATFPDFAYWSDDAVQRSWEGPLTHAVIRITDALPTLENALRSHDSIPVCWFCCVLKTDHDRCMILNAYLYFAQDPGVWNVEIASEKFDDYCFWPM